MGRRTARPKTHSLSPEQVAELRARWEALVKDNYAKMGDAGTCVLGAGLTDDYGGAEIIGQYAVCRYQGSLVWETGLDAMLAEFNAKHGTRVRYYGGRMD